MSISPQYPIVELLTGLLAVAVIANFGLSLTALGFFLFCAALVTIIWIDLHHQIIPDVISLPGIIFGFAFSGGGDIKLLAMLGAFLGWQSLLFIIFASSVTGTVAGLFAMRSQKKGGATRIPFGPFLAVSGLFYLFFRPQVQQLFSLYLDLFR